MKYSVAKIGPLVYIALCLLYIVRLDILFYNPLPLLFNLAVLAAAIFALMVVSEQIDKRTGPQILGIHILFSYVIAYSFNGALFGTMDRIMNDTIMDRTYRAFSIGFIIPSGIMLLFICGNFSDRIRNKHTKKARRTAKSNRAAKAKDKAISPVFEK